jgi:ribosomal protein S27AE
LLRSQCPACGAPVTFQSAASTFAVCGYCSSTIVRKDEALEALGKMALLIDDASPVQLGAQGIFRGQAFQVIGRIQYTYDGGVWNEWHILFANGRSAWLSELNGRSTVTLQQDNASALPAFESLQPGGKLTLANQPFEVAYVSRARVVAGAGELPFAVGAGYDAPVADLRGIGHPAFATLDYSEAGAPRLYMGLDIPFADLKMTGLREERVKDLQAGSTKNVECPNCGAAVQIKRADTRSITCGTCHSTLGVEVEGIALLKKYERTEFTEPPIPLGKTGVLGGRKWTVVGFLQRFVQEEGTRYFWDEYLTLDESTGSYGWLTCDSEGWKFGEVLGEAPEQRGNTVTYKGESYKLSEEGTAVTDYVLGEFNWRTMQGERAYYQTFKRGDAVISKEKTAKEITWSRLDEVGPATLSEAFKVAVPPAGGGEGGPGGGLSMPGSNLGSAAQVGDAVKTAFTAKSGLGCGTLIIVVIVVIVLIALLSRNNCDPRYENCSSGSSYSRGSSGGYSSGGGSHK